MKDRRKLRCWSCASGLMGPRMCLQQRPGFPDIGEDCPGFDYDPGSDEAELYEQEDDDE